MEFIKSQKFRKFILIFFVLFFASYLLYQVCMANYMPVKTETALLKTVEKGIDTTVFVVRDEHYMNTNNSTNIKVPLVNDGERIANGECIAAEFTSKEDADRFVKAREIEQMIEKYETLKSRERINISDIKTYDNDTNSLFDDYIEEISSGNFNEARKKIDDFCDRLTSRQIAMGEEVECDALITQLKSELSKTGKPNPSYIYSDSTGYYLSNVDGYENVIDYSSIDKITTKQIEEAISTKKEPDNTSVGKIVNNFNWYMLCSVKSKDVENLNVGDTVTVRFKNAASMDEEVSVYAINREEKEKVSLVLKSNSVTSKSFPLRIEEVKIITETFDGYKIDKDALRTLDGANGVYILRGRIVGFRRVTILHTEENYVVVRTKEKEQEWLTQTQEAIDIEEYKENSIISERNREESQRIIDSESAYSAYEYLENRYISLYDEVIVEGRDIYAGKLV